MDIYLSEFLFHLTIEKMLIYTIKISDLENKAVKYTYFAKYRQKIAILFCNILIRDFPK